MKISEIVAQLRKYSVSAYIIENLKVIKEYQIDPLPQYFQI